MFRITVGITGLKKPNEGLPWRHVGNVCVSEPQAASKLPWREKKCDVTLPWWQNHDLDLNNLSWQGRPFALSNDGRKVWATVLFLSAIMHRKGIHVNFFVLSVPWTTVCSDFATMATWRNDFSSSLRRFWFAPLRMKGHITDRWLSALVSR